MVLCVLRTQRYLHTHKHKMSRYCLYLCETWRNKPEIISECLQLHTQIYVHKHRVVYKNTYSETFWNWNKTLTFCLYEWVSSLLLWTHKKNFLNTVFWNLLQNDKKYKSKCDAKFTNVLISISCMTDYNCQTYQNSFSDSVSSFLHYGNEQNAFNIVETYVPPQHPFWTAMILL